MHSQKTEAGFSNPQKSTDTQMNKHTSSISNETSMHKLIGSIDSFDQKDSLEFFKKHNNLSQN